MQVLFIRTLSCNDSLNFFPLRSGLGTVESADHGTPHWMSTYGWFFEQRNQRFKSAATDVFASVIISVCLFSFGYINCCTTTMAPFKIVVFAGDHAGPEVSTHVRQIENTLLIRDIGDEGGGQGRMLALRGCYATTLTRC